MKRYELVLRVACVLGLTSIIATFLFADKVVVAYLILVCTVVVVMGVDLLKGSPR